MIVHLSITVAGERNVKLSVRVPDTSVPLLLALCDDLADAAVSLLSYLAVGKGEELV